MGPSLKQLLRQRGNRRRRIVIRPIRVSLADRKRLAGIGREMVALVYSFVADFEQAMPVPGVTTDAAHDDFDRILSIILTQTNAAMARLQLRIRDWATSQEQTHRTRWKDGVLSATGIDISTVLHPHHTDRTVGTAVSRSTALIRDIGDEARKRIGDAVIAGVQQRKHPRQVAKEIMETEDMSYRRAENIAADQSNKLNASLDRARQEEVGITGFTWRHSGKVHARPEHLDRDGEFYDWDTTDIEPGDFPGEPPFCGCVAQATIVNEDGQASDDPNADVPDDMTGEGE